MNFHHIAIIGVGGLGSRHLQALQNITIPVFIQAVDISEAALQKAQELWGKTQNRHVCQIEFLSEVTQLHPQLDIVIIATSANVRRAVIEQLLKTSTVKYLVLEKILFQTLHDYEEVANLLAVNHVKTWVNCPRRMFESYSELRTILAQKGNLSFLIQGSNWGLGCNLIHMVDMIDYLTNTDQTAVCNGELLDAQIVESKRPGFIEFTGTVSGSIADHKFIITSAVKGDFPITVHIVGTDLMCIIKEVERKVWIATRENHWIFEERAFEMPYQSQLSHKLIENLVRTGSCSLPTLETSQRFHLEILKMFLDHLNKAREVRTELCPIT